MLPAGPVSYHDYQGLVVNEEEKESLVQDLGNNKVRTFIDSVRFDNLFRQVMILRNHGLLTCGSTIPEAFFHMYMLNRACEAQVAALSAGRENLIIPDPSVQQFTEQRAATFNPEGVGQKEFAALLRRLDSVDTSYME